MPVRCSGQDLANLLNKYKLLGLPYLKLRQIAPRLLCKAITRNCSGMTWHRPALPYKMVQDGSHQTSTGPYHSPVASHRLTDTWIRRSARRPEHNWKLGLANLL